MTGGILKFGDDWRRKKLIPLDWKLKRWLTQAVMQAQQSACALLMKVARAQNTTR